MSETKTRAERRKERNKRYRKLLSRLLAVFLCLMIAVIGGLWYFLSSDLDTRPAAEQETAQEEEMVAPIDKVNIMVIGVDRRNEDIGRSDTLFIVTADPKASQLSILSVPRDTRVMIPDHGYNKINHAYAIGGHALTEKTVEKLLNMPIDHYVLIDFKAFYKIIDALGGIDIYVDERMYYEDPWDDGGGLVIDIKPGMQHMDGKTAIQYVRYRGKTGDIGRIERQQKFLKAVMDRVSSPAVLTKIPAVIYQVSEAVETDLSVGDMFSLAAMFKEAKDNGMRAYMVPGEPVYLNNVSYWMPNVEALREQMANEMGIMLDAQHKAKNRQEAAAYNKSLPSGAKSGSAVTAPAEVKKPVRLRVIDASGGDVSPVKIEAKLDGRNINVVSMASSPVVSNDTLVIASNTSRDVISEIKDLPFAYTLRIERDEKAKTDAVLILGKDFLKEKE